MIKLSIACLMSVFVIACASPSTSPMQMSADEMAIREVRKLSNTAIAEKDTLHIADAWMDNFLVISSIDRKVEGREENMKMFVKAFNERPDVIYLRTPSAIEVMEDWNMASEVGTWEGSWTEGEAKIEIGGTYYAKWHKVDDHWLLRAEIFTPTHCKGGSYCDSQPIKK